MRAHDANPTCCLRHSTRGRSCAAGAGPGASAAHGCDAGTDPAPENHPRTPTSAMASRPASSDPVEELAELQGRLYDLVVTRVTQTHRRDALRRLRRDAQEAAALAEDLADAALRRDGDVAPR
jgi:hypothetical protein